ncbi:MAG: nucleotidyltransferase family protein [Candidatus Cloacimonadota bacterium]|nr:nucleotidyltransferase family protein [Candidatus Cloacimonadota bacterium]
MRQLDEIKKIIKSNNSELKNKYLVKNIAIFGSYARNEQRENSDIDILVEFREPVGLLFVHLADYLEEILEKKVDLLTSDAIKLNRKKYIMEDLTYV